MKSSRSHRWIFVGLAVMACSSRRRCGDDLDGRWTARNALVYYDHLEHLDFDSRVDGRAVWGWEQHVHFESRFTYRTSGERMTLTYLDDPAEGDERDVAYRLERGDWRFERDTPVGRESTRCRRRIVFDESPFPPDTASSTIYYADCSR